MGKTYDSGIKTTKDRRGQIAPSPVAGVTDPGMRVSAAPPDRGKLIPKMSGKSGEPAGQKSAHRIQRFDRHGAQYRIQPPMIGGNPTVTPSGVKSPPAAATQANGRILPARTKRQVWSGSDFWDPAH